MEKNINNNTQINNENKDSDNGKGKKILAALLLITLLLFVSIGISNIYGNKKEAKADGDNVVIDESEVALAASIDAKPGAKSEDTKKKYPKQTKGAVVSASDNASDTDKTAGGNGNNAKSTSGTNTASTVSTSGTSGTTGGTVLGAARNAAELEAQLDALNTVKKQVAAAIDADTDNDEGNAAGSGSTGNANDSNAAQNEADRIAAEQAAEEAAKEAARHLAQVEKLQNLITALQKDLENAKGDSRKTAEIAQNLEGASEKFKSEVTSANKALEEAKQAVADMANTSAAGMKAVQELASANKIDSVIALYYSKKADRVELDSTGKNWAIGGTGNKDCPAKDAGANSQVIAQAAKDSTAQSANGSQQPAAGQTSGLDGKLTTDLTAEDAASPEMAYKVVKKGTSYSVIWCPDYAAAKAGDSVEVYVLGKDGKTVQKGTIQKIAGDSALVLGGKMDYSTLKLENDAQGNPVTVDITELQNVTAETYSAGSELIGSDDVDAAQSAVEAAVNSEILNALTQLAAENNTTVEEEANNMGVTVPAQTSSQSAAPAAEQQVAVQSAAPVTAAAAPAAVQSSVTEPVAAAPEAEAQPTAATPEAEPAAATPVVQE
jgi:hypothetical protein